MLKNRTTILLNMRSRHNKFPQCLVVKHFLLWNVLQSQEPRDNALEDLQKIFRTLHSKAKYFNSLFQDLYQDNQAKWNCSYKAEWQGGGQGGGINWTFLIWNCAWGYAAGQFICGINYKRIQRWLLVERNLNWPKAIKLATAIKTTVKNLENVYLKCTENKTDSVNKIRSQVEDVEASEMYFHQMGAHSASIWKCKMAKCDECLQIGQRFLSTNILKPC